jgi:hypothetical protein
MELKTEWRKDVRQFYSGVCLFVGKWNVGNVEWISGSKNDPDPKNYGAYSNLPGLKTLLDKYKTAEEAQKKVESATKYWFKQAGVEVIWPMNQVTKQNKK